MKISIVGAGNGGVFTALHYGWYLRKSSIEIELIHDPQVPSEPVGQASVLDPPRLLFTALGFYWSNNSIHATPKSGLVYEGWGKVNECVSNPFPADKMGMHYCPSELQKYILDCGYFKVIEKDVDPKDVDADYVFDCRGKPKDLSNYDELKNPINSVILAKPNWNTLECLWSRHVATPDGWTFIIPTHPDSPSHDYCVGYLYNSDITSKEDAQKNCLDLFDVDIKKHLSFNNYVAKDPVVDDRIFLNGNRLFFMEPLESSATQTYLEWARYAYDMIVMKKRTSKDGKRAIRRYIDQVQNFVLWHYQFGSKYDTPFWNYAQNLTFKDPDFNLMLKKSRKLDRGDCLPTLYGGGDAEGDLYGYWDSLSFKTWESGMTGQPI